MCPDTSQITLTSESFITAAVYDCAIAQQIVDSPGAYGDLQCETNTTKTAELIDKGTFFVHSREITQHFSPNTYMANGTLAYMQENWSIVQLNNSTVQTHMSVRANQESNELYD